MTLNYYYQSEAIKAVYDYFASGKTGNPLIALPTGTGKSHVISGLIQGAMQSWPSQRFMCMTHVKELVKQNAQKLIDAWPTAPMGIYSAGLRKKEIDAPIIYGGIGSIKNNVDAFGHRDIVIIDEAHLLSPKAETTYQKVLRRMKEINPYLKVVGLTATPYRLGQGMLTDGNGIFTDICYDLTTVEGFNRLVAEGYISPLIPQRTHTQLDVSNVRVSGGEFIQKELQAAVDKTDVTYKALQEICTAGVHRNSWLIFATGVDHAEHVATQLNSFGIPCAAVHSKIPSKQRDEYLKAFREGRLRCLVNNNVLTTGFDHPPIDLIGMLRPTSSPSLWVQMAGRGTRPSPGKRDCLLLDFAGNTARLGPINDPNIPRKGKKKDGEMPVKICPECGTYNHLSVTACVYCGYLFPKIEKLSPEASEQELLRDGVPVVEMMKVDSVLYHLHPKHDAPNSLRVSYFCGLTAIKEWVHLERGGLPGRKAQEWWRQRYMSTDGSMPVTIEQALALTHLLTVPRWIKVWTNKKYPEVLGCEF